MSDIAIRVENLGKKYKIGANQARYQTLRESIVNGFSNSIERIKGTPPKEDNIIWALKDINFEVKHGEVLGIIGRNGAGKSTLLKILSRITKPTTGRFELNGRVGSLLEVGIGFHPELTGRENIYLSGAILGMKRNEINHKFDEIVDFAEIAKFLDTPAKHYSSGMYMRLAFSVAAHLETEILLIDEVLAVGDGEFQKKCLAKMDDVAREGRTVLFVSHNMTAIKALCNYSILLSNGEKIFSGKFKEVIEYYQNSINSTVSIWENNGDRNIKNNQYFTPIKMAIVDSQLNTIQGAIPANEKIGVLIKGNIETLHHALTIGFAIYAPTGELLFWSLHKDKEEALWPVIHEGINTIVGWIPPHLLNEGIHRVELLSSLHFTEWINQPGNNTPMVYFNIQGGLSYSPYWITTRPGLNAPILDFDLIN